MFKPATALAAARALLLLGVAALLAARGGHAAAATTPWPPWHTGLHNTGWSKKDGAPATTFGIAQRSDGMMLFAARDGLYQFDGVRFERTDSIDGQKLVSARLSSINGIDGAIWVGYKFGGLSVFDNAKVRHYTERDGLPPGAVRRVCRTPAGTAWISAFNGMYWLDGARWHAAAAAQGLPAGRASTMACLDDGSVLTIFPGSVYRSAPNTAHFKLVLAMPGITSGVARPDGSFLLSNRQRGMQLFQPSTATVTPFAYPDQGERRLNYAVDERGGLWSSTSRGVQLLDQDLRPIQNFTGTEAFTGLWLLSAHTDREGNLWFGTENGINRLRQARLTPLALGLPEGVPTDATLLPDTDGAIWVGNSAPGGVAAVNAFRVGRDGSRLDSAMPDVLASYRQPDGVLWFASLHTLWRRQDGQTQAWPLPPELDGNAVQAMTRDPGGKLWISVVRKGLYSFQDGAWLARGGRADLDGRHPISLLTDQRGRVWLGYTGNRLALLEHGVLRQFDASHGLNLGTIYAMSGRAGRTWLGGDAGLAYWNGARAIALADSDGQPFPFVTGVVETAAGELWLHDADGLVRIGASELAAALASGSGRVAVQRFGYQDGHKGAPVDMRPLPTLHEGSDGRLWYATVADRDSVGWIDPAHIVRNGVAPDVFVTAIKTDASTYLPATGLTLPQRTSNLRIDFTATALSIPEQVRFRYRLVGIEQAWRTAGVLRQASYSNLGPGDYRFEVMAANEDGVWSRAAAVAAFRIAPTFVQTIWFKLLCGGAAALAAYLLYRARLASLTARIGDQVRVRLQERQRIARTLHDSFLQSVQALMYRFQHVKATLPDVAGAHQQIEQILRQADAVLAEGRDRVMDLRVAPCDLPQALQDSGRDMAQLYPARWSMCTVGSRTALAPEAQDELLQIGREAMLNAFQHAQARSVALELHYSAAVLRLTVRDDGIGLPAALLAGAAKPGHWGLTGMRERAARLGAALELHSGAGAGTRVEVQVPARRAYLQQ